MSNEARSFKKIVGAVLGAGLLCFSVVVSAQGTNIRGDIELRREWVARLQETEMRFYDMISSAPPPYILFYSTNIRTGNVNYETETADVSVSVRLFADSEWFSELEQSLQTAQSVLDGLNATNRKDDWQLQWWPLQGVTETNPFRAEYDTVETIINEFGQTTRRTVRHPSPWRYNMTIELELVNQHGRVIGSQTINFDPYFTVGTQERFSISTRINISLRYGYDAHIARIGGYNAMIDEHIEREITFNTINVDDINDNLTIRVARVNGQPPEKAQIPIRATTDQEMQAMIEARQHAIANPQPIAQPIEAVTTPTRQEATREQHFLRIERGVVLGFAQGVDVSQHRDLVIPSEAFGQPVTAIGDGAFDGRNSRVKLTSVVIPNSVTTIGDGAFANNEFKSGVFPIALVTRGAQQRGVTLSDEIKRSGGVALSDNITSIGNNAFANNQLRGGLLTAATIGNGAFSNNALTDIRFTETVTTIGSNAFANNQLTEIIFPNSVRTIARQAFSNNSIRSVTIGANVNVAIDAIGLTGTTSDGRRYMVSFAEDYYNNRHRRQAGTYTHRMMGNNFRLQR